MNKSESKLLSKWPRHHSRGMTVFILSHGVVQFTIPFVAAAFLFRLFVFNRHPMQWHDMMYPSVAGLAVGILNGVRLWRKMERLYADVPK